jgi:LacI family transcriptional regulator
MVTQKTISENLGVSQATVSYALTGYRNGYNGGKISEEIRESIVKEAMRLKYQLKPSSKRKRSNNIALLNSFHRDNFWVPGLLKGVQDFALDSSYMVTHHIFNESELPEQLLSSVDGVIAIELPPRRELERIAENLPVVLLNINDLSDKYDTVMPDHYNGIRKAIRHLYGMGHRKFGFFGIRDFPLHHAERFGAYSQVVSELNLPVPDPSWIFIPNRKERSLHDVELKVKDSLASIIKMKDRPTAMICAADAYALSFIKLAPEMGIRIPEDMSVVGFDDIRDCEKSVPSLSSVSQSLEEMGHIAAKLLIEKINGNDEPPVNLRVAVEWKPRNSIAAPAGSKS